MFLLNFKTKIKFKVEFSTYVKANLTTQKPPRDETYIPEFGYTNGNIINV